MPALADETQNEAERATLTDIVEGQSEHDYILRKIEEERQRQLALQQRLTDLQNELSQGTISLDEARLEAKRLRAAASAQKKLIDQQEQKMDRLVNEYDLYRRQNSARWVLPIVVGLYAADRYANAPADRLLWGFAGFGAMMAWEQTGYGPGRAIGSGIHFLYTRQWEW